MIEQITTRMASNSNNNPFYGSVFVSLGNYNYLIGALFILIAILIFTFYPKSKRKMENYKKRQLEIYNKNRPKKRDITNYNETKLYLPFFEKVKWIWPIMIGIVCIFIAITFFVGKSLTTL